MHYLLFYEKAPDHAEREPQFQKPHLAHVMAAVNRGELILGGPLTDSPTGDNVLLFAADTTAVAEQFAKDDPYVQHGIVTHWQVRPWQTVVGKEAACPLPMFAVK
jgi:hypothetical protein